VLLSALLLAGPFIHSARQASVVSKIQKLLTPCFESLPGAGCFRL